MRTPLIDHTCWQSERLPRTCRSVHRQLRRTPHLLIYIITNSLTYSIPSCLGSVVNPLQASWAIGRQATDGEGLRWVCDVLSGFEPEVPEGTHNGLCLSLVFHVHALGPWVHSRYDFSSTL